MRCRAALGAAVLVLGGCVNIPDSYAPPEQRKPQVIPDPTSPLKHFVPMNDEHAEKHFLRDISSTLEDGTWRWTGQKPTMRFVLKEVKGVRFVMDFILSGDTMKQTGPVTITYRVNGKVLDTVRYEQAGPQHFEKAVDASWLFADSDNVVAAELDKVYIAEADKAKLGVPLLRAGFMN